MEEIIGWIGAIFAICGVIGVLTTVAVLAFKFSIFLGFIILFGEMCVLGEALLELAMEQEW